MIEKRLKILGVIALIFGIISSGLCFIAYGVFLGIYFSLPGLILSMIYIYQDTKHQVNKGKYTIGFWAMLLSSIPVIFLLSIIILQKM